MSPCCPAHTALPSTTQNTVFKSQGIESDGRRAYPEEGQGTEAGLMSVAVTATAQSQGAATSRPAPFPADATQTGRRPRPLTQGRVSWIHGQTQRRHPHLPMHLLERLPGCQIEPQHASKEKLQRVRSLTLPQPSPRPCAVAVASRAHKLRHRRASPTSVHPPLGVWG